LIVAPLRSSAKSVKRVADVAVRAAWPKLVGSFSQQADYPEDTLDVPDNSVPMIQYSGLVEV